MVDRHLIRERIEVVRESLKLARRLGKIPEAKFTATPEVYMLAERCLHLAMEAILDIANHVVSDRDLGTPVSYADAIEKLASAGIISRTLMKKLIPWVGFRNILVHGYIKLDHGKTHNALRRELSTLETFIRSISNLL